MLPMHPPTLRRSSSVDSHGRFNRVSGARMRSKRRLFALYC